MTKPSTSLKLLDAAEAELIACHGHMEMSAVARRAGLSVGLAYHHFGSKAGLMAGVIDRFYGPIREIALGETIPLDLPWLERERARAEALLNYFYDHPLAPLVAGRLAREPEVLDIERAHMDTGLTVGARNIRQGQALGVVSVALVPEVVVAFLMGGMRLVIEDAVRQDNRPPKDQLLDQIWQLARAALGILPEPTNGSF